VTLTDSISKISEHLFLFRDVCNVYIVKNDARGLLINAGKGRVLNSLDEMGIEKIDWIIHTHHHRDLCQGDSSLIKEGAKIAVPASEWSLFEDAKGFWHNFNLFSRYKFTPTTFTPRQNIPVDARLEGETEFSWFDLVFQVVETPGPTEGSISLVSEIDGAKVAFTGDLIHSPGKVWNLHSLQRGYGDACRGGVGDTVESLELLKSQKVEMLLPSHGIPIRDLSFGVSALKKNLQNVVEVLSFEDKIENKDWHLLPHLWYKNTSYFIVSASGNVMVYDYMGATEDQNFWASQKDLDQIEREVKNFKGFDVVLPSHYHDDHVAGFNKLRERYKVRVWGYENLVDILENPSRYNLPCLFKEPIKVDRTFRDGATFQWEEYEFTIYHFPGQTEYHMAMYGVIDGKRVLFVGDSAISPSTIFRAARIIPLNYCCLEEDEGVMKCAKLLLKLKPDYVLPSHRGMVKVTENRIREYISWAEDLRRILTEATAQPDINIDWDPNWVSSYPYYQEAKAREKIWVIVNVRNHLKKKSKSLVNLEVPDEWKYSPSMITKMIPAKSTGDFKFQVLIPSTADAGRTVIGANIVFNGIDYGELAEAIIYISQSI